MMKTNYYLLNLLSLIKGEKQFQGWGRKRSGRFALWCHRHFGGTLTLKEDGFIRSIGLGTANAPSFSTVSDTVGIYYDATCPSTLENLLKHYDFQSDTSLMTQAAHAIDLIRKHHISKYNHAPDADRHFQNRYHLDQSGQTNILIVAQTAEDASLKYGMAEAFSTRQMIDDAQQEYPNANIYVKIHPDVLSGKKKSDIAYADIPKTCTVIDEDVNPIGLLQHFDAVYTKTSGMGMEALLLGKKAVCYGMPFYAGWGLTTDRLTVRRRNRTLTVEELFAAAYILYPEYHNPYTGEPSDIIDTIETIVRYRNLYRQNDGSLYFFGFSGWKQKYVTAFFPSLQGNSIFFCNTLNDVLSKGLKQDAKLYIWGKKHFPDVEAYAHKHHTPIVRVEDGFIRSVSLGSDLTKPYSLVADSRGIYFDPSKESDLEHILNTCTFSDTTIRRAQNLQRYLTEKRISKYNSHPDKKICLEGLQPSQTVVLVPGQVEDDASIIFGAGRMTNLALLKAARENAPDAFIIYKPHPDVLAGNRKGHIERQTALHYCNTVITDASLDSVLDRCDEVHTMTSLVGFEALIRHKKVYTYGLPFYAGWGLTTDAEYCPRRTRSLTLDELVAATLIYYPRYIDPHTDRLCEIELLLHSLDKEKSRYNTDRIYRLAIDSRNAVSRKLQLLWRTVSGE